MRKILCLFLIFCSLFVAGLALSGCRYRYSKETNPENYLSFSLLEDGTYTVDGFKGRKVEHLVIPASYNGIPVTAISKRAFYEEEYWNLGRDLVKSLRIEEGVRIIGESAFSNCMFEEMRLADSIERIEDEAFLNISVSFLLPANVKEIGVSAFENSGLSGEVDLDGIQCGSSAFDRTKITKVKFSSNIEGGMFRNCGALTDAEIGEGVTHIDYYTFENCSGLKNITLPSTLESIGRSAFAYSGIESIELSSNVTSIGESAFAYCSQLKEVVLHGEKTWGDRKTFWGCTALDALTLCDYRLGLEAEMFYACPLGNIQTQGECIFIVKDGCLAYKTTPNTLFLGTKNVTSFSEWEIIGGYAFGGRTLGDIKMEANLSAIQTNAFYSANIQSLDISSKTIGTHAFYYTKFGSLEISSEKIAKCAFEYAKVSSGAVTIKEGCKTIEERAFVSASEIATVYLPASLELIEPLAFAFCNELKSVYYAYEGDAPVYMSSSMYDGDMAVWEKGGRYVEWTMKEDFRLYVKAGIYEYCKQNWTETPYVKYGTREYYFLDKLSDYIAIY